jgi:lipopolysaccharide/colanic/teichoic acid biosynthesis glycosyltransferase
MFEDVLANPITLSVSARSGRTAEIDYLCRRAVGILLAALLLILLAPFLLGIVVLIRLDTPGPAIYVQERVGSRRRRTKTGKIIWELRIFRFYKFRSMTQNADPAVHKEFINRFCRDEIRHQQTGLHFKLTNDPRVTRLGRLLRKTSIDELPQLINVLKGDMTLVGPRPLPLYEVAHYREADYRRFAALPGITGLWQVRGRGRVPFGQMIEMDVEYTRRCSLWLDLGILLSTVPAVFSGYGAN